MYRDNDQREFARALHNEPADGEMRLWHFLRAQQLRGRKFRRQARAPSVADGCSPYVVDLVCFADKLIVELDGPQHLKSEAARGFRAVRFRNQELDEDIRAVVDAIGPGD
jgi:very-short-patch-repair endonuclease